MEKCASVSNFNQSLIIFKCFDNEEAQKVNDFENFRTVVLCCSDVLFGWRQALLNSEHLSFSKKNIKTLSPVSHQKTCLNPTKIKLYCPYTQIATQRFYYAYRHLLSSSHSNSMSSHSLSFYFSLSLLLSLFLSYSLSLRLVFTLSLTLMVSVSHLLERLEGYSSFWNPAWGFSLRLRSYCVDCMG